jgi:predicted phosphodiesterase
MTLAGRSGALINALDEETEEEEAGILLKECEPDFFLTGHIHHLPYESTWNWKVGKTTVLNAGCRSTHPVPNHIVLDLPSGELKWVAP